MKAVVSSGLLFTYLFFNKLTSKPGSVNTVMGWSQLIIHRFIRILPPYLALVVLLEPLSFFLCRCQSLYHWAYQFCRRNFKGISIYKVACSILKCTLQPFRLIKNVWEFLTFSVNIIFNCGFSTLLICWLRLWRKIVRILDIFSTIFIFCHLKTCPFWNGGWLEIMSTFTLSWFWNCWDLKKHFFFAISHFILLGLSYLI